MKLAIILPALSLAVAANAQPALVKEHQQVPIGKRLLGTITSPLCIVGVGIFGNDCTPDTTTTATTNPTAVASVSRVSTQSVASVASVASVSKASVAAWAVPTSIPALGLQTFTGALGGFFATPVTVGGRGFIIGTEEVSSGELQTALTKSCDNQHNLCANAANALGNTIYTVGNCDTQNNNCKASITGSMNAYGSVTAQAAQATQSAASVASVASAQSVQSVASVASVKAGGAAQAAASASSVSVQSVQSIASVSAKSVQGAAASASAASVSSAAAAAASSKAIYDAGQILAAGWQTASDSLITDLVQGGTTKHILNGVAVSSATLTTPLACTQYCDYYNWAIAGVTDGDTCFCGNTLVNGGSLDNTSADKPLKCSGGIAMCGGDNSMYLYYDSSKVSSDLLTTPAMVSASIAQVAQASQSAASIISVANQASASAASVSKLNAAAASNSIASVAAASNAVVSAASVKSAASVQSVAAIQSAAAVASAASVQSVAAAQSNAAVQSAAAAQSNAAVQSAAAAASVASVASVSKASAAAWAVPTSIPVLGLQTFTGALGGFFATPVVAGGRGFIVGTEEVSSGELQTALTKSCDNQKNLCANAANLSFNLFYTVGNCDTQNTQCKATIPASMSAYGVVTAQAAQATQSIASIASVSAASVQNAQAQQSIASVAATSLAAIASISAASVLSNQGVASKASVAAAASAASVQSIAAAQSNAAAASLAAVQSNAAVQSAAAVQSLASVQSVAAAQSNAAVQSAAAVQSNAAVASIASVASVQSVAAVQSAAAAQSNAAVASVASVASVSKASAAAWAVPTSIPALGLQTFTGALGGFFATPVVAGGRGFIVGLEEVSSGELQTALTKSCDNQNNLCANGANLSFNLFYSVANCNTQNNACKATIPASMSAYGQVSALAAQATQSVASVASVAAVASASAASVISVAASQSRASAGAAASIASVASVQSIAAAASAASVASAAAVQSNAAVASIASVASAQSVAAAASNAAVASIASVAAVQSQAAAASVSNLAVQSAASVLSQLAVNSQASVAATSLLAQASASAASVLNAQAQASIASVSATSIIAQASASAASVLAAGAQASQASVSAASILAVASASAASVLSAQAQASNAAVSVASVSAASVLAAQAQASLASVSITALAAQQSASAASVLSQLGAASRISVASVSQTSVLAQASASAASLIAQASQSAASIASVASASAALASQAMASQLGLQSLSILSVGSLSLAAQATQSAASVLAVQQQAAASIASVASVSAAAAAASAAAAVFSAPKGYRILSAVPIAEGATGRALDGASTSADDMTNAKCAAFCTTKGFAISGTEYASECYCGNAFVNGASPTILSPNAVMACSGDKTQLCGAGAGLNVVYNTALATFDNGVVSLIGGGVASATSAAAAATTSAVTAATGATGLPAGYAVGSSSIIAEGNSGRALTGASTSSASMTPAVCAAYCTAAGFALSGTEYGVECYCGNALSNGASLSLPSTNGPVACGGAPTLTCGAGAGLSIVYNTALATLSNGAFTLVAGAAASATSIAAAAATSAAANAAGLNLPSGYQSAVAGVIAEGTNGRALIGASTSSPTMTNAICAAYCTGAGFALSGTEYGVECYCGNSLSNGASLSNLSPNGVVACGGLKTETCGAGSALTLVYNSALATLNNGVFTLAAGTVASASSVVAAAATSSAAVTASLGLPAGYSAASPAIIAEGTSGRALTGAQTSSSSMTPTICATYCTAAGFALSGTEYSTECFCGNALVNGASLSALSPNAAMACAGDKSLTCGAGNGLTLVYNTALASVSNGVISLIGSATASAGAAATSAVTAAGAALPAGFKSATSSIVAEGTNGRALTGASTSSDSMTNAICAQYCTAAGFALSGTEYSTQCFCGNSLSNGASLSVLSPNAAMPCGGAKTETCGAGNGLSITYNSALATLNNGVFTLVGGAAGSATASAAGASATSTVGSLSLPAGFKSAASSIIAEGTSGRALTGAQTSSSTMTNAICAQYCTAAGFALSGTEYTTECFCGNSLSNGASLSAFSPNTGMVCGGAASEICGAPNGLTLVYNSALATLNNGVFTLVGGASGSATSVAAAAATSAAAAASIVLPAGYAAGASSIVAEGTSGRALTGASTSSSTMTNAICAQYCTNAGFAISGTEYSTECYCGNTLSNGAALSILSPNAGMPCGGSKSEICGAGNGLTIAYNTALATLSNGIITAKAATASASAPAAAQTSTAATSSNSDAAVTLDNGFSSTLKCYSELPGRAMKGAGFSSDVMTYDLCTSFCGNAGFSQAGVEWGRECYCSNGLDLSTLAPNGNCIVPCSGDATSMCGGPQALQIFTTQPKTDTTQTISTGWSSAPLCLADGINGARTFADASYSSDKMTVESCTAFCASKGSNQAGLEYGSQCFCASNVDLVAAAKSSNCNMAASGNQAQLAGGGNALSVWTLASKNQTKRRRFPSIPMPRKH